MFMISDFKLSLENGCCNVVESNSLTPTIYGCRCLIVRADVKSHLLWTPIFWWKRLVICTLQTGNRFSRNWTQLQWADHKMCSFSSSKVCRFSISVSKVTNTASSVWCETASSVWSETDSSRRYLYIVKGCRNEY